MQCTKEERNRAVTMLKSPAVDSGKVIDSIVAVAGETGSTHACSREILLKVHLPFSATGARQREIKSRSFVEF